MAAIFVAFSIAPASAAELCNQSEGVYNLRRREGKDIPSFVLTLTSRQNRRCNAVPGL